MHHLRFLRYIDEIARCGSIRQAAERLHVAPSAVNRRLQDIEEELGTPVFERLPRGMRLTAAGELFVNYIRGRAAELEQVRSRIEELRGLRRGTVRIAASQALAASFLPAAIASFRRTHALVDFKVDVADHLRALAALRAFETDVVLVIGPAAEPDLHVAARAEQPLMAVMHRGHPLAGKRTVRLRDCAGYPLVMPNADTAGRQLLERYLAHSSIKLHPFVESNSFELLRNCVYHQRAITFQLAIGAVTDGGNLVVKPVEERRLPRAHLVLASLAGRRLPVIAHAFIEHLLQSPEFNRSE